MEYKCNLCNKIFNRKSVFDKHNQRKRSCIDKNTINDLNDNLAHKNTQLHILAPKINDKKNNNIINNEILQSIFNLINNKNNIKNVKDDIKCQICGSTFTRNSSLQRHMKNICDKNDNEKILLHEIKESKKIIVELLDKQKKLDNEFEKLKVNELSLINYNDDTIDISNKKIARRKNNNLTNTNSNNNANNNTNSNNNNKIINNNSNNTNINICSIGAEDISKLSAKVLRNMYVCDNEKLFLNSVEGINFNPELPQNHNISYRNLRSNDCQVYDDNKWCTMDIKEVIKMLLSSHSYYIKRIILENNNLKLSKYIRDNIMLELIKYNRNIVKQDEIDRVMEDLEITVLDDIEICHEKIYNSFKRLLYDKSKELNIKTK